MKSGFKQVFDNINMPIESQNRIRLNLSNQYIKDKNEEKTIKAKPLMSKRLIIASIIAAFILTSSISAAIGMEHGDRIIQMLTGGFIELKEGDKLPGRIYIEPDTPDPVEIKDGRVYLTMDGSGKDITDYVSESTYYFHEADSDDFDHHIIVIGGNLEYLGWAEIFIVKGAANITTRSVHPSRQLGPGKYEVPKWYRDAINTYVGLLYP